MSYGRSEQRCKLWPPKKHWQHKRSSKYSKYIKKAKHRVERYRIKQDIECFDEYNRYDGYEN